MRTTSVEDKLKEISFTQALVVSIALAGFYYFFVFSTNNPAALISQNELEIAQFEGEIKKFDKEIAQAEKYKEEIKVLEKEISVKFSYVSENLTKSEILQDLSVEARQVGLSIESIGDTNRWKQDLSLEYLEVPTRVTGDFSQIMEFLSNLSREKKLIIVNKFQMSTSATINLNPQDFGKPREVFLDVIIRVFRKVPGQTEYTPGVVNNKESSRMLSSDV